MADNYARLVEQNLKQLFSGLPRDMARRLPAEKSGDGFVFRAFGETCVLGPDRILLEGKTETGVKGILISLYALHATTETAVAEPFRAFVELPDSRPFAGAFAANTERVLTAGAGDIETARHRIVAAMDGGRPPEGIGGDFAFRLRPLPKISLCYIFYRADEDFPASATCLYSANAQRFMPTDALADVGEYTSKKILDLAG